MCLSVVVNTRSWSWPSRGCNALGGRGEIKYELRWWTVQRCSTFQFHIPSKMECFSEAILWFLSASFVGAISFIVAKFRKKIVLQYILYILKNARPD